MSASFGVSMRTSLAVILDRPQGTIGTRLVKVPLWRMRCAGPSPRQDDAGENLGESAHVSMELAKLPRSVLFGVRPKLCDEIFEGGHRPMMAERVPAS